MLPEETTVLLALPPLDTVISPSVLMTAAFAVPRFLICSPAEVTDTSFAVPFAMTVSKPPLETLTPFAVPAYRVICALALTTPPSAVP